MAEKETGERLEIAARLVWLRRAADMTSSQFARSVDMSPQAWYNYEKGRRALNARIAALIVARHHVDYNFLYAGWMETLSLRVRRLLSRIREADHLRELGGTDDAALARHVRRGKVAKRKSKARVKSAKL